MMETLQFRAMVEPDLERVMAIENDPHFRGGDYYDGAAPEYGLALARMVSHKTFVHLDAIERARKAGCGLVQLTTDASRPDAHRFYERLGWQRDTARDWRGVMRKRLD